MLHLCFAGGLRVSELANRRSSTPGERQRPGSRQGSKRMMLALEEEDGSCVTRMVSSSGQQRAPELFPQRT
jgi:hypothetical protein